MSNRNPMDLSWEEMLEKIKRDYEQAESPAVKRALAGALSVAKELDQVFQCGVCGGFFVNGTGMKEAVEEATQRYGEDVKLSDLVLACDKCWNDAEEKA